jgi:hypothetical protein
MSMSSAAEAWPTLARRRAVATPIIVLGGALGLILYLVPDRAASLLGLEGLDRFAYGPGGAAFLGYAVALLSGWNAPARAWRIILPAATGAAIATAIAALISFAGGHGGTAMAAVLAVAIVVAVAAGSAAAAMGVASFDAGERDIARWLVAFFGWGVVASGLFGLGGLLLGGTFGALTGAHGTDDPVYRLAGAATIGILVGSVLTLRSRNWGEIRLVAILGFVTNLLTLISVPIVVIGGGAPTLIWLIGAAAAFNVVGLGLALYRKGR